MRKSRFTKSPIIGRIKARGSCVKQTTRWISCGADCIGFGQAVPLAKVTFQTPND